MQVSEGGVEAGAQLENEDLCNRLKVLSRSCMKHEA